MKIRGIQVVLIMALLMSGVNVASPDEDVCYVPCEEIVNGGPGKDGIPSIDDPKYYSVSEASDQGHIGKNDRVIVKTFGDQTYIYPYNILNHHEIVNHRINGIVRSITYCPLTGTGIVYKGSLYGQVEVGVSGNLYENNLIFYDRNENKETWWSQMYGVGLTGDQLGEELKLDSTFEGEFELVKKLYPNAKVLSRDTGYSRDYDNSPYGNYDESSSIYFGSEYSENSNKEPYKWYHPKELTGVFFIDNETLLIPFSELSNDPLSLTIEERQFTIFFDKGSKTMTAFENQYNGKELNFKRVDANLPIFEDQEGRQWNILGQQQNGDSNLNQINGYMAYWFAATSFFKNASIYHDGQLVSIDGSNPFGLFTGQIDRNSISQAFNFLTSTGGIIIGLVIGIGLSYYLYTNYRSKEE